MNKQEQIEAMAKAMSCKDSLCRQYPCDNCPYVSRFCGRKEEAERLVEAGYINGKDFVEWLKNYRYGDKSGTVTYLPSDEIEFLKDALQEYLK